MIAVKFADGSEDVIEGLLLPYGGLFDNADLYHERFTKDTDFCLSWSKGGDLPLLYHHGLDPAVETGVVGRIKRIEMRDTGGWMQAQLDASSEYFSAIKELIKRGALSLSSGAMAHLVKVAKSGDIRRWPVVEGSLTPSPANLLATVDFATASRHYKSAGLELPEMVQPQAIITTTSIGPDGIVETDTYTMSDTIVSSPITSGYSLLQGFASAKGCSRDRLKEIVGELELKLSEADMDDMMDGADAMTEDDIRKRLIHRKVGNRGKSLTAPEIVSTILDGPDLDYEAVPIGSHAETVSTMAASLVERTKDLHQRRIKEGRVISDANRKRIMSCMEQMGAAMAEMQTLMDSSAPMPKQGTEGPTKAAALRRQVEMLKLRARAATLPLQ